ncbi:hypothetical protein [Hyalangium rubrum]|uniref:Uncharacterized protein n=1 Tax=Hyalangium rubrum TaxID=3103134 RepID=A0ABU5HES0_9BACT|nr:hypothetical protein [Hyalangium sp. s54d21]MDY7231374.1 hypothetical protein [Hyalangium sp. s54d21]
MAKKDLKQPTAQPAEDMFGRPTDTRHSEPATREGTKAPVQDKTGSRKSTEQEDEDEERRAGGINDIPDGDGPRSDRGTNPLPDVYWADYQGDKS